MRSLDINTGRSNQFGSGSAILFGAVFNSFIPLLIHKTAPDINPFLFHALWCILLVLILVLLLAATKRKVLDGHPASIEFNLRRAFNCKVRKWLYRAAFGAIDYGIFIWSTQLVATAVSTTVYELWPVFLVYCMLRYRRKKIAKIDVDSPTVSKEHMFLSGLAAVALLFMLGIQLIDDTFSLLHSGFSSGVIGITLAFIAAYLAGISVSNTLFYGEELYVILLEKDQSMSKDEIENLGSPDRNLLLWLTFLGRASSLLFTSVISLAIGLKFARSGVQYQTFISGKVLVGAVLLTVVGVATAVLLRIGNIGTSKYGVNSLNFLAPFLAIIWLMIDGIEVPRFDLFIAGGALALAINVLIQLKPDEDRDITKYQLSPMPGVRLGFTAFIMSIWAFGTFIYIRDKIMGSWATYVIDEYWGLLALSSTIFALILSFRLARLTTRINKEDETMLSLFRNSECLVKDGIISRDILKQLADLDTASTYTFANPL